jgi:Fe-S cluster biosynthesis and repair protein YggX
MNPRLAAMQPAAWAMRWCTRGPLRPSAGGGMEGVPMSEITCTRCGRVGQQLGRPPLRNELGARVHASICQDCWDQWLRYQTALINHNGLDVREKPAREFLSANMEAFLFRTGSAEQIDTSRQGTISW